ncbi:hypothetical protein PIB30_078473, partial [Stylosanthes scabra]|nr:hypothetical protein [Stylosanthes scabra]
MKNCSSSEREKGREPTNLTAETTAKTTDLRPHNGAGEGTTTLLAPGRVLATDGVGGDERDVRGGDGGGDEDYFEMQCGRRRRVLSATAVKEVLTTTSGERNTAGAVGVKGFCRKEMKKIELCLRLCFDVTGGFCEDFQNPP